MSYFNKRKNALRYALAGLWEAFKREPHLKLHLLAAMTVVSAGFYFKITTWEWITLCMCIGLVFSLELINSAIEKLCDLVTMERHSEIKYIKDISAAAVLIVSLASFLIGIFIFWPYFKTACL